jgi:hypothetical protein
MIKFKEYSFPDNKRCETIYKDFLSTRESFESYLYSVGKQMLIREAEISLYKSLRDGYAVHYFIENGIEQFLIDSVCDIYDQNLYKALPFETFLTNGKGWWYSPCGKIGVKAIILNFNKSSKIKSILVMPFLTKRNGIISNGVAVTQGENVFVWDFQTEWPLNDRAKEALKLVCGFSLYIDAFPEMVQPHTEGGLNFKMWSGSRNIVACNDVARADIQHSVSPHYRRGHFRILTSDRYVRKKGQTVYVKGAFIKGKAFDVVLE